MSTSEVAEPRRSRKRIGGVVELVITLAVAIGAALLIQALLVKPYRIPSPSMVPTLQEGQRILVNRLSTHPDVGDVVVFHPPAGADRAFGSQCGDPAQGPGHTRPCDEDTPRISSQTFVKRVVGLPGDTLRISHGDVYRNGVKETGSYIQACPDPSLCTFAGDHRLARPLLPDGRQPRDLRRQPLLGAGTAVLDHRDRVLQLLASRSHRHPLVRGEGLVVAAIAVPGVDRGAGHGLPPEHRPSVDLRRGLTLIYSMRP